MQLQNPFSPETRELFHDSPWCWECGEVGADALHHIRGRVSSSAFNSAAVHNARCHIGRGDIHLPHVERRYLAKTARFLREIGYQANENDRTFLKANASMYVAEVLDFWLGGICQDASPSTRGPASSGSRSTEPVRLDF